MDTQQLIIDALPLAANIASNISKRLPPYVDSRDVLQEGCLGLLDAAMRYDAAKGVPFGAYARRRISGAVLDGLRREDHLSRSARAQIKAEGAELSAQPVQLTDPDQLVGVLVSPHDHAAETERQRLVADAIETLPVRLRVVLRAHYYEGKFMREIGEEIGVGDGYVSHMHRRALELLRQYFETRGFSSLAEVHP
jgi:RNA polymerase sigma factor for flagellar operon FliA